MKSRFQIEPMTGDEYEADRTQGVTLTDDEVRTAIYRDEIKREDLPLTDRDRYREELKKARRY